LFDAPRKTIAPTVQSPPRVNEAVDLSGPGPVEVPEMPAVSFGTTQVDRRTLPKAAPTDKPVSPLQRPAVSSFPFTDIAQTLAPSPLIHVPMAPSSSTLGSTQSFLQRMAAWTPAPLVSLQPQLPPPAVVKSDSLAGMIADLAKQVDAPSMLTAAPKVPTPPRALSAQFHSSLAPIAQPLSALAQSSPTIEASPCDIFVAPVAVPTHSLDLLAHLTSTIPSAETSSAPDHGQGNTWQQFGQPALEISSFDVSFQSTTPLQLPASSLLPNKTAAAATPANPPIDNLQPMTASELIAFHRNNFAQQQQQEQEQQQNPTIDYIAPFTTVSNEKNADPELADAGNGESQSADIVQQLPVPPPEIAPLVLGSLRVQDIAPATCGQGDLHLLVDSCPRHVAAANAASVHQPEPLLSMALQSAAAALAHDPAKSEQAILFYEKSLRQLAYGSCYYY
jgi:hypothetical protein